MDLCLVVNAKSEWTRNSVWLFSLELYKKKKFNPEGDFVLFLDDWWKFSLTFALEIRDLAG